MIGNRHPLAWIVPYWGRRRPALFGGVMPDNTVVYGLALPMVAAQINAPMKHPGMKPSLSRSLVTPQSMLRGVPYLEAVQNEQDRLASLELR